jgi:hypothetical protein
MIIDVFEKKNLSLAQELNVITNQINFKISQKSFQGR